MMPRITSSFAQSHNRCQMNALCLMMSTLCLLPALTGCAHAPRRHAAASESIRDPRAAERLHQKATVLMASDPAEAEKLLREAIAADIFHGPAHNNLGTLLLARGELYEAATNFEAARKLMPGHPDPRLNLALTYEKAARYDDAIAMYNAALEVSPGHAPTVEALTRLEVTSSRTTPETTTRLRTIALEGSSEQWREWAKRQLLRQRDAN